MNDMKMTCPICERGELTARVYAHEVNCEDARIQVRGMEHMVCDVCGADPVLPAQAKRNQLRIADARRQHMGLLTGEQIRAVRDKLGLSQPQAADLFGGGANAFSKYERGETLQSISMDRLLRLVAANPNLLPSLAHPEKLAIGVQAARYEDDAVGLSPATRSVVVPRAIRRISEQTWQEAA